MYNTRIEITYLDGLRDVIITDSRSKRIGVHLIEVVTDNFFKRLDDVEYKQQRVQMTSWDKYKIEIISMEDYSVELLRNAKLITIGTHTAKIIDVAREKTESDLWHISIEYYDVNLNNYKYNLPPVDDYLRSDALSEQFTFNEMNVLRVADYRTGALYDYNTMLEINQTAEQPERSQFINTQTGQQITTDNILRKNYEMIFYLNKQDIQSFQTVLPLADQTRVQAILLIDGHSYNIKQQPEVTVEKLQGHDIFKGTCVFVNEIIKHNSYGI